MSKIGTFGKARRWINSLSAGTKWVAGFIGALVAIWFAVTPVILWSADRVNEANHYTKEPWVVQYVQQQQAPIQGAVQGQSALFLRQWWNQNRWAIQALEQMQSKRRLLDWERRKLNDLHDERDAIILEYKKAGLTPPST